MCGIVGRAGRAPAASRGWLAQGCAALAHRGPDGIGEWWSVDGRVGLGHRRLAIIDLSPGGHQPMHDDGLSIVFNGEIYNHRELRLELEAIGVQFRSRSDTEVILKAYRIWGEDCIMRLNGMFAFALYDAPAGRVLLARDRAGEKPLFYRHDAGELRFASELKALLADSHLPRRIDPQALDLYLSMGFVPAGRCMLDGYAKLPPAHYMTFDLATGMLTLRRYWEMPTTPDNSAGVDSAGLVDELEQRLEAAVRRQLIADVPVGVLLSGGVDSSIITALAARSGSRLRTFTISFPGHDRFDESPHARLVASYFGTEHEELAAEPAAAELLPALAEQFDEPIIDSSMIPTFLVAQAVRRRCTVALGGDGGDELFAGYSHHQRLAALAGRAGRIPWPIRRIASMAALAVTRDGRRGRNWIRAAGARYDCEVPLVASYFDRAARRRLLPGMAGIGDRPDVPWAADVSTSGTLLDRTIRTDFRTYLPEDILVKVDRAAMLNSLEVRAPFLDSEVIAFAYGRVPIDRKGSADGRKLILRELATRLLPHDFDRQRKQGFSIPLAAWLRDGPFRALFREVLLAPDCSFDRAWVAGLLDRQDQGYQNEERLFGLVQFELWRRRYAISL